MTIMRPRHRIRSRLADSLQRQLRDLFGPGWSATVQRQRDWASATFVGARYTIACRSDGPQAEADAGRVAAAIGDHEFSLPGAFVAEARIVERHRDADSAVCLLCECLVIDDA